MKWLLALLLTSTGLHAGSVRLFNNSPYTLKAVVKGADGSILAEAMLHSHKEIAWADSYGRYGRHAGANVDVNAEYRSKTPYTVLWYCMNGSDYAICNNVATGSTIRADSCSGARMCQKEKSTNTN